MRPFDYIVVFFSMVVSLALADVVLSLHKLLRAHGRVRWHWMAPATAWISAISVLAQFWRFWDIYSDKAYFSFVAFLPYVAKLVIMFLSVAAALPDEVPAEGLDLKAYYYANRKYYWGLSALYLFQQCVLTLFDIGRLPQEAILYYEATQFSAAALCLSLMFIRASWWHSIGIAALIVSEYFVYGGLHIG